MNLDANTEPRPELVIRRNFDAPRELVYRMWTDPEHLERWCCPTGFTITHSEGEIRVDRRFRTCMRSPEGFTSVEARDAHRGGWEQTFDSLDRHLAEVA